MKGILFRSEMVKAIVEGRKTQTRRVIKPQPSHFDRGILEALGKEAKWTGSNRYQVGEVVYIKEAWYDNKGELYYRADWAEDQVDSVVPKWRSPLFMPAWAARYFIQITDVRVERLQEITPDDCVKEGLLTEFHDGDLDGQMLVYVDLRGQYQALWDSINPKCPWANNPWCFVYTFQLVDKKK